LRFDYAVFINRKKNLIVNFKLVLGLLAVCLGLLFTANNAFAHHVLQEIPVGTSPMKMSMAEDLLFVSNLGERQITIIDIKNGEVIGEIVTSSGVVAVEAVPEKNVVYAATFESGGIDVYDLETKEYVETIELPDAMLTTWHSPGDDKQVYLHLMTGGAALDYNPNNEVLYVANYNANYIATIDTATNQVIEKIPVSAHPFAIKVDSVTNKILIANMAGNEITFLVPDEDDQTKHSISSTVKTGTVPWGIDIDTDNHRAYISHRGAHHITVLDTITEKIVDKIEVGDDTQAITVDSDERQIYVSYLQQNKIVKINGKTNQIVNTIESGALAWDLAADSKTHKLYATMKGEDKVFVLGPESISMALPVVTIQTPIAYVGNILAHGQDVYVSEAAIDTEKKALVLVTQAQDGGKLVVQIPRAVLDAKRAGGGDSMFMVYADNKLIDQEIMPQADGSRYVSIDVPRGTESVTISGTQAIPEFGPIAGAILAAGIFSIVILARKQFLRQ
jgi:YVTN family beta-propeller protein